MILCTTFDFTEKHCLQVFEKTGKQVQVSKDLQSINDKNEIKVLLTYGNYDDIITETALKQLPNLEWIQLFSAGYDSLPLDAMAQRNIQLTTASGVHAKPISEYVLSMILYFYKDLSKYLNSKGKRQWDGTDEAEELEGKMIGILGTGHIGSEIAKKSKALGLKTIGLNRDGRMVQNFDEVFAFQQIDALLSKCDIVCSVLPSTTTTIGLMNKERFRAMKDGAIFINTGRGDLVVESDFITALNQGKFKGAALDVFAEEPLPPDHVLWGMDNLIITPHISARSNQYMNRCVSLFLKNLAKYESQQWDQMINVIDIKKIAGGIL
jgi:phosphoglycerate dehydrogenase-like enzyme